MRQSIGMSQQLNIMIIFILIVFALIAASLSYYKAFKVSNTIVNSIEKYEGFNDKSKKEIENNLKSLGYQQGIKECASDFPNTEGTITTYGYCVNEVAKEEESVDYSYDVVTYMTIDMPIIDMIKIPVKFSTKKIKCIKCN